MRVKAFCIIVQHIVLKIQLPSTCTSTCSKSVGVDMPDLKTWGKCAHQWPATCIQEESNFMDRNKFPHDPDCPPWTCLAGCRKQEVQAVFKRMAVEQMKSDNTSIATKTALPSSAINNWPSHQRQWLGFRVLRFASWTLLFVLQPAWSPADQCCRQHRTSCVEIWQIAKA